MDKTEKQRQVEKMLHNTVELTRIVESIPKNSALHRFSKDVQFEVISRLVRGETPYQVSAAMEAEGKKITWQQCSRIQKRLQPLFMENEVPNAFFYDPAVESQMKKVEFLISEQYARVIDKLNTEDEMKGTLRVSSTVKDPATMRELAILLDRFYKNELNEVETKYLLSFCDQRGYDASLTKDISELVKMHKEYLALRAFLGDKSVSLTKESESEQGKKAIIQVLDEKTSKQVSENMRKAALNVINMVQKESDSFEAEKKVGEKD